MKIQKLKRSYDMLANLLNEYKNSERPFKIKLLGDSITHGVGGTGFCQNGKPIVANFSRNPDGFCWAKLFKEYMEEKYNCVVENNACTGTNIEFVIHNFDTLVDDEDDFVICTIGTNNRHQYKNTGDRREREEFGKAFYGNVLRLSETFSAKGKNVVLVANIPASSQNEQDANDYWRILHMDDINEIYKRAQNKAGFNFISMYELFSNYLKENDVALNSLLKDGLHPNDEGYRVMFGLIKNALRV